jgi:hypothetical protein
VHVFALPHRVSIDAPARSAVSHFPQTADDDADGVPNSVEVLPDGDPDGNDDAIPDSQQPQIASLPAADGGYVTLIARDGTWFANVARSTAIPPGAPAEFPLGLFEFTLEGLAAGEIGLVSIFHEGLHELNAYYKFDEDVGWYDFEWNETTGAQFFEFDVVLAIQDGGRGDADGVANGVIVDPGGPAFVSLAPQIASVVVNDGHAQRSMVNSLTVTFTGHVTIGEGAFEVRKNGVNQPVHLNVHVSQAAGQTIARLTFEGTGARFGSLLDGAYRLTIRSDKITAAGGAMLDGDGDGAAGGNRVDEFFRLFGDIDGDRDVDLFDTLVFASTFGARAGESDYLWYLDWNASGRIWLEDLAAFTLALLRSR